MKYIKTLFVFIFLIWGSFLFGQNKVEKAFQKAIDLYEKSDFQGALKQIDAHLKLDSKSAKGYILKGDIYSDLKMHKEAIDAYSRSLQIDSFSYPSLYIILGNQYFEEEKYLDARKLYKKYATLNTAQLPDEKKKFNDNLSLCEYRINIIANPLKINLISIGDSINTQGYEFMNALSLDGNKLYFTRRNAEFGSDEDFYVSDLYKDSVGQRWNKPAKLGEPFNSNGNEGAMCVSADGNTIILTACNRPDSYGGCDLYISTKAGGKWTTPQNLGPEVNSSAWESQPYLAADGKTLYFASKRAGGYGGSDIWKSTLLFSGIWSKPQNLGSIINTAGNEMSPFLHPDQKTLYFSSDGHKGMGGLDIFFSRLKNKQWQKPENIGYPINTNKNEINLIVNTEGINGFVSVERQEGKGNTDIYGFLLPQFMKPVATTFVRGKIFDKKTKAQLRASLELINVDDKEVEVQSISDNKGEFIFSLPLDRDYALNVACDGYLFYSLNFSIPKVDTVMISPKYFEIPLDSIEIGKTVVLNNIFFKTDKYDLLPTSIAELQKLVVFLKKNPKLIIEISGHTDDEGSEAHNLWLSHNRAKAVYDYLVKVAAIAPNRLSYKGFGQTFPTDTNKTQAGKANNRRTEFKIVKK